ncbi:MAG: hypothetical protein MZW92_46575 [Comamonadaceae bacterium]|nr:hypothetical protein [Comamonadaceae bacterium]
MLERTREFGIMLALGATPAADRHAGVHRDRAAGADRARHRPRPRLRAGPSIPFVSLRLTLAIRN